MKKIILRLDLNVPIDYKTNKILETERIDRVILEIKNLSKKNYLNIISHLGKGEDRETLSIVEKYLRKKLTKEENININVLENIRFSVGETAKENSKEFKDLTKKLSGLGDIYIDDAFASMHRPHASIVGIPKLFKKEGKTIKIGDLTKIEIKNLEKSLKLTKNPKNNTLLILSGAKISTKLPLIKKFIDLDAKVFVSGGIANQIFKDILNINIGLSFIEKDFQIKSADKKYLLKAIKNGNIILPIDSILRNNKKVELLEKLNTEDYISDIGPATFIILKKYIENSKNIIMNGPLGIYEEGFTAGTIATLKLLNKINNNVLIGGGDTLVLTKKLKIKEKNNLYISTGGGAMLEYLIKEGKLPGIEAVK